MNNCSFKYMWKYTVSIETATDFCTYIFNELLCPCSPFSRLAACTPVLGASIDLTLQVSTSVHVGSCPDPATSTPDLEDSIILTLVVSTPVHVGSWLLQFHPFPRGLLQFHPFPRGLQPLAVSTPFHVGSCLLQFPPLFTWAPASCSFHPCPRGLLPLAVSTNFHVGSCL